MGELLLMNNSNQMSTYEELYREYLDDRTLVLNDEINENVIEDFVLYILKWNKEDLNLPVDARKPIKVYISSPGGNVFDGNILSDVIEASKTPIIGIAMDLVASAAFHVYISCHERISYKNSAFLLHDGEIAIENSRKKAKDTMEFLNEGSEREKQHVLNHTKITEEFYDSIYESEFWLYATKAKEFGIVDKIIGEDITIDDVLIR